jgi:hypothetical protein
MIDGDLPTPLHFMRGKLFRYTGMESGAACLYFLCEGDRVVYVGRTCQLTFRVGEHLCMNKAFDRVFWMPVATVDIGAAEVAFIKLLEPKLNPERFKSTGLRLVDRNVLRPYGDISANERSGL